MSDPHPELEALRAPPPAAALAWVAEVFATGSRVLDVRRLTGGISSSMHVVRLVTAGGGRARVVLRRWIGASSAEGAERVDREAGVLAQLGATSLPAPSLLAADPSGAACDAPALVMSWRPGRLHLTPHDPAPWLDQMARLLVEVHHSQLAAPPFEPDLEPEALEVPAWTSRPILWRDAIARVRESPPASEGCFVHGDCQQFNVLWRGERLASVVDWTSSAIGPAAVDVAHCRLNLTLLYSPERAEQFRSRYESIAGTSVDPWWDLAGLLGYLPGWGSFLQRQAGRRLRIDFAGMHERMEVVVASALRRL
jgi:aminoglycoside phosphotransferase (APT) family kinase protein